MIQSRIQMIQSMIQKKSPESSQGTLREPPGNPDRTFVELHVSIIQTPKRYRPRGKPSQLYKEVKEINVFFENELLPAKNDLPDARAIQCYYSRELLIPLGYLHPGECEHSEVQSHRSCHGRISSLCACASHH